MAKLNKHEIGAIASRLERKLKEAAEQHRKEVMASYKPSENYKKAETLLTERDRLKAQIATLEASIYNLDREIEDLFNEKYECYYMRNIDAKTGLDKIIKYECKLDPIPESDILKEDITIAAIDEDFDVEKFIQVQLRKYK